MNAATDLQIPEAILRPDPNLYAPWMLVVLLLGAVIVAFIRVTYPRRLPRMLRGGVRLQILRLIMREEPLFSHRASLMLFLNFALSLALILYCAAVYYRFPLPDVEGWLVYLYIFFGVVLIYLIKLIAMLFLGYLYRDPGLLREYTYEVFLLNNLAGLLFLPLALVVSVINIGRLDILFPAIAVVGCGILLFRYIQGGVMSFSYRVSSLYIILYLCTLEILPIALVLSAVKAAAVP